VYFETFFVNADARSNKTKGSLSTTIPQPRPISSLEPCLVKNFCSLYDKLPKKTLGKARLGKITLKKKENDEKLLSR